MTVNPGQGVSLGSAAAGANTNLVNQTAGIFTAAGAILLASVDNETANARSEWTISGGTINANATGDSAFVVGRGAQKAALHVSGEGTVNVAGRLTVSGVPATELIPTAVIDQSMNVSGGRVTAGEIRIGQSGNAGANRNSHFLLSDGTVISRGDGVSDNSTGAFVAIAGDDTTGATRNISIDFQRGTLAARTFDLDLTGADRMVVGDGLTGQAILKFINEANATSTFADGLHIRSNGILATSTSDHQIDIAHNDLLIDGRLRVGDADFNVAGGFTPGVGSFTINGQGLTLTSTAELRIDIASLESFDRIHSLGADRLLTYGGSVVFNLLNGFQLTPGDAFQVFGSEWAGRTGSFSSISGGGGVWSFDNDTGTFVAVIPEPAAGALLGGVAAMIGLLYWRSRRAQG